MNLIKTATLAGILMLMLAGCNSQAQNKDSNTALSAASAPGQASYRVIVDASYAPFGFRDENSAITGYDIDILNAIAQDQGFAVTFIHHPWEGIFDTLDSGAGDIVAAAVTATEERAQKYALSDTYHVSPDLAVYTDSSLDLNSFADLKTLTVATQEDTATLDNVKKQHANNAKIVAMPTLYLALKEVVHGSAQAVVGDAAVLQYYLKAEPGVAFKSFEYVPEQGVSNMVFVMKKGNTGLQSKINTGLNNIKTNGTYAKITQQWFGQVAAIPAAASQ